MTPATFAKFDEEALRDIMLVNLATHYASTVTGETFSRSGKTDIRVDGDGRAAFIAECKVWRGSKEIRDAIDQLLGYLRWRDCKTALVVFNKDRDNFSALREKAPAALKEHSQYRGDVERANEVGEFRMVFASPDDEDRRITVHTFLFDLHAAKE
jgi:hypothetical protein